MVIYLVMFFFSALFFYVSRHVKTRFERKLFIFLALLLPSLVAGFRATSVGTDYSVYGMTFLNRARSSDSLFDFFETQEAYGNTDYGYNLIVYICSLFSKEYILEMFAIQLITVSFIYLGFERCERRYGTPVWLAMLLYYFMQYSATLNIMRQSLAVSISFYAFTQTWDKKYAKYALFMLIAFSMHSSAVIGLALPILYWFLQRNSAKTERQQLWRALLIVAAIAIVIFLFNYIVTILVNIGILSSNFLSYLSGGYFSGSNAQGFSVTYLAIQGAFMFIYLFYYRSLEGKNLDALFFTMCSLMVFIINVLSPIFAKYMFRMSYYFVPLQMGGLANITLANKKGTSRIIWAALITAFLFAVWFVLVVIIEEHETVPYEFYWS